MTAEFHTRLFTDRPFMERLDLAYTWILETKSTGLCSVCDYPITPNNTRLHIFKHLGIGKSPRGEHVGLMTSVDLETLLEVAPALPAPEVILVATETLELEEPVPPATKTPAHKRTCNHCHTRFATLDSLKIHIQRFHPAPTPEIICILDD